MKVGKTYSLHFGKDIYIKYRIISFENDHEDALLERIEDGYMGADDKVLLPKSKLYKKRIIRNW